MEHINYSSYDWVGDKEKACDCSIGLLEEIQRLKGINDSLYILDCIKNLQDCINEMEKELLLEINNNYDQCLEKLENLGIILFLSQSNKDIRYLIKGLEQVPDSRCKGWTLVRAGILNEIGLKCSRIRLQGIYNNQEFEEKISNILKDVISDESISWRVESYLLSQEKHSTSAMVYITFIF